ncbi:MAG: hypothetical protein ACD_3C00158G0001 [uncultured bacterium (gcode 4)]|uniref:Uncharacterized protein n=1 Tax=uncultured bacterium (gcode 4) TaxID=1234023 RepID=K2G0Q8_9BACT|nr:MAG: hypothetical protein ACD_3C00158G0001 [uncultured bacterium (gcode 4)]
MKSIPIILIHKWYQSYLDYSLLQAKKLNPESEIYLIGDDANKFLWNKYSIKHVSINDFDDSIQEINQTYVHLSWNSSHYELFCFQRWFILSEFTNRFNFDKFVYIDSDILLYTNVTEEINTMNLNNPIFEMAYVWTSWHTCYFNSRKAIQDFCEFILSNYTDKDRLSYLEIFYNNYSKENTTWWVSDMFMFWLYKQFKHKIIDLAEIIDWSIYDLNFNCANNTYNFWLIFPDIYTNYKYEPIIFKTYLNTKKILNFENWMYWLTNDNKIRFNTLHLQGFSKSYMKYFYNEQFLLLKINILFHYLIEVIYNNSKLVRNLRKFYKKIYEKIIFKKL